MNRAIEDISYRFTAISSRLARLICQGLLIFALRDLDGIYGC
jgi:hypothetical protein